MAFFRYFRLQEQASGLNLSNGDPDYPIWAGCWWGSAGREMPPVLLAPPYKKVMIATGRRTQHPA